MARPKKGARANGPYEHPGRATPWLVRFYKPGESDPVPRWFDTQEGAETAIATFYRELGSTGRTVKQALADYRREQFAAGNKPESVHTTIARLTALLPQQHKPLTDLTPARATRAVEQYRDRPTRRKRPPSADTVLGTLGEARTWGRWCVKKGWLRVNPFEDVEVKMYRAAGKPRLTIDETRKLDAACRREADAGDAGAAVVLILLYFGIRATEAVSRQARDLDDGGRVLRVRRLKKRGEVVDLFQIPDELRPHLERLAAAGGELFPGCDRHWVARNVRRLCKLAGVPRVGAHGIRNSLATNLREIGWSKEAIAGLLGHDDRGQTAERHYIDRGAEVRAEQRGRMRVLQGGAA